jgi:hypothetical protein
VPLTGARAVCLSSSRVRALYIAAQWRPGKLIWWHIYETEAKALEAAGLRE